VGFGSKVWCFARAENGERAKNEIWGWSLLPNPTETLATQASLLRISENFDFISVACQQGVLLIVLPFRFEHE